MRSYGNSLDDDQGTMGPGTDLMISLLAILLLLLCTLQLDFTAARNELLLFRNKDKDMAALIAKLDSLKRLTKKQRKLIVAQNKELDKLVDFRSDFIAEQELLARIHSAQMEIVHAIAYEFKVKPIIANKDSNEYEIKTKIRGGDIRIRNDFTSQRIYFGSSILFEKEKSTLKYNGKRVLSKVGIVFRNRLKKIKEIQILGHADITGEDDFNLDLAGDRANSVYKYFQHQMGINPVENIMSATSYGEYMPVNRSYEYSTYSLGKLKSDNHKNLRSKNRRIELVLNF